jgi:hypothetical protein
MIGVFKPIIRHALKYQLAGHAAMLAKARQILDVAVIKRRENRFRHTRVPGIFIA